MEGPSCCCFSLSFLSSVLIHSAIHFCRVFPALRVFVSIVATSPPTAATRLCDFRRRLSESTSAPTWHIQTNSFQLRYRTAIRSKSKKIELVSSSQHAPETQRQFVMHLLLSLLRIAHTVGASNLWSVKAHLVICLISEESLFKILLSHLNCQQSLFQETGFSAFCKQSMAIASSSAVWKHSSWGKGGVIHLCDVQRASRSGRLTGPPLHLFLNAKCVYSLFKQSSETQFIIHDLVVSTQCTFHATTLLKSSNPSCNSKHKLWISASSSLGLILSNFYFLPFTLKNKMTSWFIMGFSVQKHGSFFFPSTNEQCQVRED